MSHGGHSGPEELSPESRAVLERLAELRRSDAPTHGGRVLSYVYDSGDPELDRLADAAAALARPLNGLDPTTFPSIAVMERDLVAFARTILGGDESQASNQNSRGGERRPRRRRRPDPVVGSVTSGGTESCLLAVKTARDLWRDAQDSRVSRSARPRLVTAMTAHAAFQKAARLFDLDWDPVPCETDGSVRAEAIIERLDENVALVVVSAPAYPSGALDPVAAVAEAAAKRGISCHVDACFGGLALPWWQGLPAWDFRVPGVTSISADLHKFGYAPKGVSVLLHRGRKRHRRQFFATTSWPGYPVVNPTLLGSKSASPTAAAWAIMQRLGSAGYRELTGSCMRSATAIREAIASLDGIAVQGDPRGPAIALVTDASLPPRQRVDPHHLADAVARRGFRIQHQPGITQSNRVRLPHSAHLTITPVTERRLPEFLGALRDATAEVRGKRRANPSLELAALRALGYGEGGRVPGPDACWRILRLAGAGGTVGGGLPRQLAPLMALAEALPAPVAEALLTELLARVSEPSS